MVLRDILDSIREINAMSEPEQKCSGSLGITIGQRREYKPKESRSTVLSSLKKITTDYESGWVDLGLLFTVPQTQ